MIMRKFTMSEVAPQKAEVYRSMACRDRVPEEMRTAVDAVYSKLERICCPSFCICEAGMDGLSPGGIIMKGLGLAEKFMFFVATAGLELQEELDLIKSEGDVVNMYVADLIGSEIAEATVRKCREEIQTMFPKMGVSNAYSPGYCGWNISDQRLVFGRFPERPCGVVLNDSCLMYPIKSVSGVISVGTDVRQTEYACAICNKKDCYKNRFK